MADTLTPNECLLGVEVEVEGACKANEIVRRKKLFNYQRQLIRNFLANW